MVQGFNGIDYIKIDILDKNEHTFLVQEKESNAKYVQKLVLKEQVSTYKKIAELSDKHLCRPLAINEQSSDNPSYAEILEEYIEGKPVSERIKSGKLFQESEVVEIIKQICDGLGKLHKAGVIHRDIKPSNVMIQDSEMLCVKIIDYGIARVMKENSKEDTRHLGTVGYASPEQFGFAQSGITADIYSVGVMMNVLLTGMLPKDYLYEGSLRHIIEKCTQIDAKNRYQNTEELLIALNQNGVEETKEIPKKYTKLLYFAGGTVVALTIGVMVWTAGDNRENVWDNQGKKLVNATMEAETTVIEETTIVAKSINYNDYIGTWTSPDGVEDRAANLEISALNSEGIVLSLNVIQGNAPYEIAFIDKVKGTVEGNVAQFVFSDDGLGNAGTGTLTFEEGYVVVNVKLTDENINADGSLELNNEKLYSLEEWKDKYGISSVMPDQIHTYG